MKKALVFMLLVISVIASCAPSVNAWCVYPEGQGIYIPDAVQQKLEKVLEDGDEIVGGLDTVPLRFGFSLVESFDQDFWTTEAKVRSLIIKKHDASFKIAKYNSGTGFQLKDIEEFEQYDCLSGLLRSPERVLSKTGKQFADMPPVFLFYDNYDCAVYFRLEDKEYVYMRNHSSGTEYLFYADTYLKYAKWQRSEARFLWDLSAYDINSPDFDLDAPTPDVVIHWVGVFVVVVAGALVLSFTIRRRKKRRAQTV